MKETIAAFNCFRHRYPSPLRVFLQLPAEPAIREKEKEQDAKLVEDALSEVITSLKLLVDQSNNVLDVMQRIADSLRINEEACQTAKEQMNIACEEIGKQRALHFLIKVTHLVF